MKHFRSMNLAFAVLLGMGVSSAAVGEGVAPRCIELWPQIQGLESLAPNGRTVESSTNDRLVGTMAHLAVYVERQENGHATFDPAPQQMFIFPTVGGRYVVRFLDVQSIPGWYYGYHAPF